MKIRLLCTIEADIVAKEELESIQANLRRDSSLQGVTSLWRQLLTEKLKNICPSPVYLKLNFVQTVTITPQGIVILLIVI